MRKRHLLEGPGAGYTLHIDFSLDNLEFEIENAFIDKHGDFCLAFKGICPKEEYSASYEAYAWGGEVEDLKCRTITLKGDFPLLGNTKKSIIQRMLTYMPEDVLLNFYIKNGEKISQVFNDSYLEPDTTEYALDIMEGFLIEPLPKALWGLLANFLNENSSSILNALNKEPILKEIYIGYLDGSALSCENVFSPGSCWAPPSGKFIFSENYCSVDDYSGIYSFSAIFEDPALAEAIIEAHNKEYY